MSSSRTLVRSATAVADLHILDHFWIEFCLNIPKPSPVVKRITYRKTKSIGSFSEDISKLDLDSSDVFDLVGLYNSKIAAVFDKYAPKTTKSIVIRPNTQWYNANLRHAKTVRIRLERRLYWTNNSEAKEAHRKQCDIVNHLKNEAKTEFLECGFDRRRLFNFMKGGLEWNKKPASPFYVPENALVSVFSDFSSTKSSKSKTQLLMTTLAHHLMP